MLPLFRIAATVSILLFLSLCGPAVFAQGYDQKASVSPLRLSYIEGMASFWREGAPDWISAQLNTPLAAGDGLYIGNDSDLELQMGSRAFVRADDNTQLTLVNQTADFIQFRVASGRVSFDLRALPVNYSVEVDTPNAVFTIDHTGYYRVDVGAEVHFITRRGGLATMIPAGGKAMSIHPSEEIVVRGDTVAEARTYVAPELDQWDRWNYDRTDGLVDTISERYLPYGVAGVPDLDHYGNWRVVSDYGPVWVPDAVPFGWRPYSTGRWVWDPYYQWTWIDDAPWGWAPFHYGRWVYLGGYWAWAPGPVSRRPVYAPALVLFLNVSPSLSIGISSAGIGWVALGWGEPLFPWWGQPSFIGKPWWGGWRGPRVTNNVYRNTRVNNAVVATTHEHFGRGHVHDAPVRVTRPQELQHVRGALQVKPGPTSLVGGAPAGARPPEAVLSQPVIGTRPPRESRLPWRDRTPKPEAKAVPEQRQIPAIKRPANNLPRPEFGTQTGEERPRAPMPPRFEERRRAAQPAAPAGAAQERAAPAQAAPMTLPAPSPETPPQRILREATPPRAVQERERATPEPRRIEAAPATPRAAPAEIRQQERAVQERERVAPEPRRIEAAPAAPRAAPAEIRQQERTELPGNPANRIYNKEKKKEEQRRPDRKPE